jgi:transformation/transcription domain-associated protein
MREPNQPTPLRASFTVVAPQGIPHGHPIPPPNVARSGPPQQQQIESLLHTLESASTQRIDLKLQHLKDFFKNYDELATSPAYLSNAKTFIGLLIRLLNETVAHYVVENETHELRKLILEALFRMSFMNENVRQYAKEIQKTMLNVILHDNEENALLALKIIIDHLRVLRLQFTPEVSR